MERYNITEFVFHHHYFSYKIVRHIHDPSSYFSRVVFSVTCWWLAYLVWVQDEMYWNERIGFKLKESSACNWTRCQLRAVWYFQNGTLCCTIVNEKKKRTINTLAVLRQVYGHCESHRRIFKNSWFCEAHYAACLLFCHITHLKSVM